jgi:hypothetical protein
LRSFSQTIEAWLFLGQFQPQQLSGEPHRVVE